jgi:cytochrome c553
MYGRGCVGCHAPHNGPQENGSTTQTGGASFILWGEDVTFLAGKTLTFGDNASGGPYAYSPGTLNDGTQETKGILLCLSCHDGSVAQSAMMKGVTYESVTLQGATSKTVNPPTWLGKDGGYANDHPVGPEALWVANTYSWSDATISSSGKITPGKAGGPSALFNTDYGFFVTFATDNAGEVLCTTCHNQHDMTAVQVKSSNSGMSPGIYSTMFFLVGPYTPNSTANGANSVAQFCRQCHGYGTNESMLGVNQTVM